MRQEFGELVMRMIYMVVQRNIKKHYMKHH